MASFLVELFSEEIPARMQMHAAEYLQGALAEALKQAGLAYEALHSFVTPRRVAVACDGIPEAQPDVTAEKKGPKTSAPQAAIDGFLRSAGLPLEKLEKRMVGKDETYFAVIESKGQPTAMVLKSIVEKILADFPWPKSMRWGSGETRWVRPLHSILCIFGGKVIPVEFAGITAGNVTYGHRFLAPDAITISDPKDYVPFLKKAHVIADVQERKALILKSAEEHAEKHGLKLKRDDGLLAEVTGLVEWPVVLMGTIDAKFMDLPPEVLVSEMRAHQKYFALLDKDGVFSDKFLITSNMVTEDGGKAVVAGNERVLRARLSDGRFFWDQDRKKPLSEWAKGLEGVTFHAKIGTMHDKVQQLLEIALKFENNSVVPNLPKQQQVQRAAQLCKADLLTGMVGEFPELQGVMGRYYATAQNEDAAVADAIRDHYLPLGPDSPIPTQPVSICIALADKFTTLVSMFAVGEKPTGSKDPFALRRTALGIIRIILENKLRLKLTEAIGAALESPALLVRLRKELDDLNKDKLGARPNITTEIFNFFSDRLKVQLKDKGIRHDVISAVMAGGDDDLVRVVAKAKALQEFLSTEDGSNLLAAYRRAGNIVSIEEKKDKQTYNDAPDAALLEQEEERKLYERLEESRLLIAQALEKEEFGHVMTSLAALRQRIDAFFDKILVNADKKELRANRLRILALYRTALDSVADFSRIEG